MKRMKKKIFVSLFTALCFSFFACNVKAETCLGVTEVKHSQYVWTDGYNNKPDFFANYVKVREAFTINTNPCPKCLISFKLRDKAGNVYTGTSGLTTQSKEYEMPCTDGCSAPGDYKIGLLRVDFTLLTTYTSWAWRWK